MLQNHLKIAWRNLTRNRKYTLINISGLTLGMTGAMLLFIWAYHEKSYENFFKNSGRIYQLWSQLPVDGKVFTFNQTPEILASQLKKTAPQIEEATSYIPVGDLSITVDNKISDHPVSFIDSSFFEIFNFNCTAGNPTSLFQHPMSAILTESTAIQIFGTADVVGKTIKLNNQHPLEVTAILGDLPNNTAFDFKILLSHDLGKIIGITSDSWESFDAETYLIFQDEIGDKKAAIQKMRHFMHPYKTDVKIDLYALPLEQRHLQANFEDGKPSGGKIVLVNSFVLIAGLLLCVACINFMNLSTARSIRRAKEVGVRKIVGANRRSLIWQFLSEALVLAVFSGVCAFLIVLIVSPYFQQLTGQLWEIPSHHPVFWLLYVGVILVTGLLAGSYPAFSFSAFPPLQSIKGSFQPISAVLSLREVLVILQFTIAVTLIIATIVMHEQLNYGENRNAGYDRSKLIYTKLSDIQQQRYSALRQSLLSSGVATSVSRTFAPITNPDAMGNGYTWEGYSGIGTSSLMFITFATVSDFLKTANIKLLEGRDLNVEQFRTDTSSLLINQTAAKAMNMTDPIGKWVEKDSRRWQIIGVVEDFILESPFQKIQPLFITAPIERMPTLHIKIADNIPVSNALKKMRQVFEKFDPMSSFNYDFIDNEYAEKFGQQRQTAKLTIAFTVLTIFISCLGLFGLTAFTTEQRTKEIGIRKVLGATVAGIATLLSREFIKLVLIALIVACPIAWWAMNEWLENFAYKVDIQWWMFLLAGVGAIAIALLTVSLQAIKAALANPVDSLRNE